MRPASIPDSERASTSPQVSLARLGPKRRSRLGQGVEADWRCPRPSSAQSDAAEALRRGLAQAEVRAADTVFALCFKGQEQLEFRDKLDELRAVAAQRRAQPRPWRSVP